MSKKVYFVRHGQTVWNVENKICGATDSPLTEMGHQQAIEAGQMIAEKIAAGEMKVDKIICSPLSRAHDTAKHIGEMMGIPVEVEPRIVEQNFGKWEGTPRDGKDFQEAKRCFVDHFEGGESMLVVAQRIYNVLDEIKNSDETYLLVAHNGIARVVRSYFEDSTNEGYAAFGIQNCQVMEYEFT